MSSPCPRKWQRDSSRGRRGICAADSGRLELSVAAVPHGHGGQDESSHRADDGKPAGDEHREVPGVVLRQPFAVWVREHDGIRGQQEDHQSHESHAPREKFQPMHQWANRSKHTYGIRPRIVGGKVQGPAPASAATDRTRLPLQAGRLTPGPPGPAATRRRKRAGVRRYRSSSSAASLPWRAGPSADPVRRSAAAVRKE